MLRSAVERRAPRRCASLPGLRRLGPPLSLSGGSRQDPALVYMLATSLKDNTKSTSFVLCRSSDVCDNYAFLFCQDRFPLAGSPPRS